jgi:hypothetical protein
MLAWARASCRCRPSGRANGCFAGVDGRFLGLKGVTVAVLPGCFDHLESIPFILEYIRESVTSASPRDAGSFMNVETGSVPSRITRPSGRRPGTARQHGHVAAEHRRGRAVKWKVGAASGGCPRACTVAGGKAGAMMGCPAPVMSVMPCTGRAASGMGISGLIRILSQMAICGLISAGRTINSLRHRERCQTAICDRPHNCRVVDPVWERTPETGR